MLGPTPNVLLSIIVLSSVLRYNLQMIIHLKKEPKNKVSINHQPPSWGPLSSKLWVNEFLCSTQDIFSPLTVNWRGRKLSGLWKITSGNIVIAWLKEDLRGRNRKVGAKGMILSGAPKGTYWNKVCVAEASQAWLRVSRHITHEVYIFCQEPAFRKTLTSQETEFYSI